MFIESHVISTPAKKPFFTGTIPAPTEEDKRLAEKYLRKSSEGRCKGVAHAIEHGKLWLLRELFTGDTKRYFGWSKGEPLDINLGYFKYASDGITKRTMTSWLNHATSEAPTYAAENTVLLLLDLGAKLDTDTFVKAAGYHNFKKETLQRFLEEGIGVDIPNSKGTTALRAAIVAGSEEKIQLLLSHGANQEKADPNGDLLSTVISDQNTAGLKYLLTTDIKQQIEKISKKHDLTPIGLAVQREWPEGIELLLNAGIDINKPDAKGYPPLRYTTNEKTIRYLLEKGADPRIKDKDGVSTVDSARRNMRPDFNGRIMLENVARKLDTLNNNCWIKTGEHEIKHVFTYAATGHQLTEVFNFSTRERLTFSFNPITSAEGIARESFDAISKKDALEEAATELEKQGGSKTARATIYANVIEREKKPLPGINH